MNGFDLGAKELNGKELIANNKSSAIFEGVFSNKKNKIAISSIEQIVNKVKEYTIKYKEQYKLGIKMPNKNFFIEKNLYKEQFTSRKIPNIIGKVINTTLAEFENVTFKKPEINLILNKPRLYDVLLEIKSDEKTHLLFTYIQETKDLEVLKLSINIVKNTGHNRVDTVETIDGIEHTSY